MSKRIRPLPVSKLTGESGGEISVRSSDFAVGIQGDGCEKIPNIEFRTGESKSLTELSPSPVFRQIEEGKFLGVTQSYTD